MLDISTFGLQGLVTATNTFPDGFIINEFADDSDPLNSPDLEIAETAFGPNGDMVTWTRPQGIEIDVGMITFSPGYVNCDILLEANRVAKGKTGARDKVGIVFTYPNGIVVTMSSGKIISGPAVPNASSAGRAKSSTYKFRFERITKTGMLAASQQ